VLAPLALGAWVGPDGLLFRKLESAAMGADPSGAGPGMGTAVGGTAAVCVGLPVDAMGSGDVAPPGDGVQARPLGVPSLDRAVAPLESALDRWVKARPTPPAATTTAARKPTVARSGKGRAARWAGTETPKMINCAAGERTGA